MNHFKFLKKMNSPIELLHPNTLLFLKLCVWIPLLKVKANFSSMVHHALLLPSHAQEVRDLTLITTHPSFHAGNFSPMLLS